MYHRLGWIRSSAFPRSLPMASHRSWLHCQSYHIRTCSWCGMARSRMAYWIHCVPKSSSRNVWIIPCHQHESNSQYRLVCQPSVVGRFVHHSNVEFLELQLLDDEEHPPGKCAYGHERSCWLYHLSAHLNPIYGMLILRLKLPID